MPYTIGGYGGFRYLSLLKPSIKTVQDAQKYVDEQNKIRGHETQEQYLDRIKERLRHFVKEFTNKKAYFLAVLNSTERASLHEIFLDEGFEVLIDETKNPTGSTITTYVYHLLPRQKKVVKSALPVKKAINAR